MSALIDQYPAYKAVKIFRVNWDAHGDSPIVSELNVPRRSTLVMFNKGEEVGRVIAQTDEASINALFESAVTM